MRWMVLLVLSFVVTEGASAGIIFDNAVGGAAGIDQAYLADADPDFPGYATDDFQLGNGHTDISAVRWTGVYAYNNVPLATDAFTLQIFADVAGEADPTPLFSFQVGNQVTRTDSGVDIPTSFGPLDIYDYEAPVTGLTLSANTTYWLSVFNDTTVDPNSLWLWGGLTTGGNEMYRFDPSDFWYPQGGALDFQLVGPEAPVPEPSSFLLMASLLGGFAMSARWGRKKITRSQE